MINRRTKVRQIKFLWSVLGFKKIINLGVLDLEKKILQEMSGAGDCTLWFIHLFAGQISAVPARSNVGPSDDFMAVKFIMAILYFCGIFHPRFYWQNDLVQIYHYLLTLPKICLDKRKPRRSIFENFSWNVLRETARLQIYFSLYKWPFRSGWLYVDHVQELYNV